MRDESIYSKFNFLVEEKKVLISLLEKRDDFLGQHFNVIYSLLNYFNDNLLKNGQNDEEMDIFELALDFFETNLLMIDGFFKIRIGDKILLQSDIDETSADLSIVIHMLDYYTSTVNDENKLPRVRNYVKKQEQFFQKLYDKTTLEGVIISKDDVSKFEQFSSHLENELSYFPVLLSDVFLELSIKLDLFEKNVLFANSNHKSECCCGGS